MAGSFAQLAKNAEKKKPSISVSKEPVKNPPLKVYQLGHEALRTPANRIVKVDDSIRNLVKEMLITMYSSKGIGLAAPQVNIHLRLIVLDVSDQKNDPIFLVNPVITRAEGEIETSEGCLSIPGYSEPISRYETIEYEAIDLNGNEKKDVANGLLAICIQHEMDHLQGKLMVDRISSTKRQLIRKRLLKQQNQRA